MTYEQDKEIEFEGKMTDIKNSRDVAITARLKAEADLPLYKRIAELVQVVGLGAGIHLIWAFVACFCVYVVVVRGWRNDNQPIVQPTVVIEKIIHPEDGDDGNSQ